MKRAGRSSKQQAHFINSFLCYHNPQQTHLTQKPLLSCSLSLLASYLCFCDVSIIAIINIKSNQTRSSRENWKPICLKGETLCALAWTTIEASLTTNQVDPLVFTLAHNHCNATLIPAEGWAVYESASVQLKALILMAMMMMMLLLMMPIGSWARSGNELVLLLLSGLLSMQMSLLTNELHPFFFFLSLSIWTKANKFLPLFHWLLLFLPPFILVSTTKTTCC